MEFKQKNLELAKQAITIIEEKGSLIVSPANYMLFELNMDALTDIERMAIRELKSLAEYFKINSGEKTTLTTKLVGGERKGWRTVNGKYMFTCTFKEFSDLSSALDIDIHSNFRDTGTMLDKDGKLLKNDNEITR